MEFDELKEKIKDLKVNLEKLKEALNIDDKKDKINNLENEISIPDFYQREDSGKILSKVKILNNELKKYNDVLNMYNNANEYLELYELESDDELLKEAKKLINICNDKVNKLNIDALLSDEYDNLNAIVTIHPGAGGVESQDFAEMLYKMYLKWINKNEYEYDIIDYLEGEEAGIKSVTFIVKGINAYGYLKCEKGVHRLVRISPFDANKRRHTSFASVEVMPEIDDEINIEIKPEELHIDTYRSSGAGGQHVNKTDSAIRIKHIPTGIVVTCQNQRSQIQNKEYAMKVLKSKLYEYEKNKKDLETKGIKGEVMDNGWGSQIRSYVFCPYTLVKDHRTGYEIGNVETVFEGNISDFMNEYLKYIKKSDII